MRDDVRSQLAAFIAFHGPKKAIAIEEQDVDQSEATRATKAA